MKRMKKVFNYVHHHTSCLAVPQDEIEIPQQTTATDSTTTNPHGMDHLEFRRRGKRNDRLYRRLFNEHRVKSNLKKEKFLKEFSFQRERRVTPEIEPGYLRPMLPDEST